ncbi:TIGR02206 family membrane protein [Streptococcus sp. Marseille-Q3533]|uniref:YwaF family protein n=1 Tax=Streptococcus TaxID=1301 RepID=UPI002024871A|nr:TIGR02206 family membrane protein [Streptococcus sp. Marseille-Q3533]
MNVWDALFTTQPTEPPQFDLLWYGSLFTLLALTVFLAYRYGEKKACQRFFQILQAVQLIVLYSWYWINQFPLSESLPFYHCRLAMFVVLLTPGVSRVKQYFAVLGTFGTLAAFVYPVPDPYPFPHIAILSFIFGHLALFGNSLIYLLKDYDASLLDFKRILVITSSLNALIFLVNVVTGGDYGFLTKPPLVGDHGLLVNYIVVTLFLTCAIYLSSKAFQIILQEKGERRLKI